MNLHRLINITLLLLTMALGGCINASTNNPDQPTTIEPPVVTPPTTPVATTPKALPLTGFKTINTGSNHSCVIKNSDDSLWCWGNNSQGQAGFDNNDSASAPTVIGRNLLWQSVSGGYNHSCGIALSQVTDPADGARTISLHQLLCWGDNRVGAVGYGTETANYYEPITLQDDDWNTASAGNNHSCAIRLDKSLWCWGDNSNDQLGHNSAKQTSPSQVDNSKQWLSVSASDQFTCALKEDQSLWCWGKNDKSQFGNGATTKATTPLLISSGWKAMATGQAHGCAIKTDNTLWCWGDNSYGQIGNGTTINQPTPFQVTTASITTWSAVTTGHQHSCAIALSDKSLWCWGNNETGQLGINSTAHQPRPVKISHTTGWFKAAAGESHTCAIDAAGISHCWGFNNYGQVGNGFSTDIKLARLFDSSINWRNIASGYNHSCGLKGSVAPYTLWCGGVNGYGQVGTGSTSSQATLVQLRANKSGTLIADWESLSTGANHSCAIAITGASHPLFCWGDNSRGQLGDNATLSNVPQHWWPNSSSQVVVGVVDDWGMVATGANNSCGIKAGNELWCWGDNSGGQIGNGSIGLPTDPPFLPTRISGSWLTVAVGGAESGGGHVCAIKSDGTLWCWGKNDKSQLGNGSSSNLTTPTKIGSATSWVSLKAGEQHTCGLRNDNSLWCWGDNSRGQTGAPQVTTSIPNPADPANPTSVTAFPTTVTSPTKEAKNNRWLDVDLGSNFTCGISDVRHLWCWGDNLYRQLTSAIPESNTFVPTDIQNSTEWQQLALGQRHGCAIREDANTLNRYTYCWGERSPYQFGDGSAWKSTPQPLSLR
ncbi:MAG: hypothetical protein U1B30_13190 [Pseudomonadota bacterium]|nr:hypothetical protein [Pseudomonadota bacterium]